ncbi:GYD domain-containing protein [Chloroflexota bacterium]
MTTFIILGRNSAEAFKDADELKQAADTTCKMIGEVPGVVCKEAYFTLGRFDSIIIVDTDDPHKINKVNMIMRTSGRGITETLVATPFREYLEHV